MDYVSKYNRDTIPAVSSPMVHSIFSSAYNEREANTHVSNAYIREDGYKVIPKPSFEEQVHSD
jgi:hypothetical protein